jgi:poly(A) polymerase
LQENGFTAYFAGGYVRDLLLGIESKDIDIVTSARPEQVEKLFKKTLPIGKKFGIIIVVDGDDTFEVATFRKESDYTDNRRPGRIEFSEPEEDAKRRDFTVNGLFYDPIKKKVIDHVGGQEDIKKKTIRFIGDADERIAEDHLRLVRAIRLKIELEFQYSPETFNAVRANSSKIKDVSAERVRDELIKIMKYKNRHTALVELSESGLLAHVIPEIERLKGVPQPIEYHHEGDVFTHTYLALKSLGEEASSHLGFAVLLHDIGKPPTLTHIKGKIVFHNHAQKSAEMAKAILGRLKFPRFEIMDICWLIENHMKIGQIDKMRPSKRLDFVLDPKFTDLIALARADASGTYPVSLEFTEKLEQDVKVALEFKSKTENLKKLSLIDGDDLVKLGLEPSAKFKEILEDIEDRKVDSAISSKEQAIAYVKEKYINV